MIENQNPEFTINQLNSRSVNKSKPVEVKTKNCSAQCRHKATSLR